MNTSIMRSTMFTLASQVVSANIFLGSLSYDQLFVSDTQVQIFSLDLSGLRRKAQIRVLHTIGDGKG